MGRSFFCLHRHDDRHGVTTRPVKDWRDIDSSGRDKDEQIMSESPTLQLKKEAIEAIKALEEVDVASIALDHAVLPEGYRLLEPGKTPEGYVSKTFMEDELKRRSKAFDGMKKPDEIMGDNEFFRQMAERRGIKLGDDLKPVEKFSPEQVNSIKEQVRNDELKPVQERLTTLLETIERKERENFKLGIEKALDADGVRVKKELRTRIFDDSPPSLVNDLMSRFSKDEERGVYYFKDDAGNPVYSDNPTSENPYAGPKKLLAMLKAKGVDIFENNSPEPTPLAETKAGGASASTSNKLAKDMNLAEKMDWMKKNGGPAAWQKKVEAEG